MRRNCFPTAIKIHGEICFNSIHTNGNHFLSIAFKTPRNLPNKPDFDVLHSICFLYFKSLFFQFKFFYFKLYFLVFPDHFNILMSKTIF